MNCGNCGKGNEYGAKVCVHCGSTLALTEYFRASGFVEKKNAPKKTKDEPWEQDILTVGYQSKHRRPPQEEQSPKREGSRGPSRGGEGEASRGKTPVRQGKTSGAGEKEAGGPKNPQGRTAVVSRGTSSSQRGKGPDTRKGGKSSRGSTGHAGSGKTGDARREKTQAPEKGKASAGNNRKTPVTKKIPKGKVYNHTTKVLSLAEKVVKKKTEKKQRKWFLPVAVILVLLAIGGGIFIGKMFFATDEERFTLVAEQFAQAVIMNDEKAAGDCVHPKMYGTLRSLGYENVERCDTKTVEYTRLEVGETAQQLKARYGITDPVTALYQVHVGCTVYGQDTYACALDVVVGEIGGKIYAIKTENIDDSAPAG